MAAIYEVLKDLGPSKSMHDLFALDVLIGLSEIPKKSHPNISMMPKEAGSFKALPSSRIIT